MTKIDISCPSCKSEGSSFVEHSGVYNIYRCQVCTLEFCNPMKAMSAKEYEAAEGYDRLRLLGEQSQESVLWWGHRHFLNNAHKFVSKIPSPKLLDIGCGTGAFVDFASKKGYEAYGVDFDQASVNVAWRTPQLKDRVFHGDTKDIRKCVGSVKYEIVAFFEVLEHVDDVHFFISQVSELLAPNGVIAVYVPLADRWSLKLCEREPADYPPNHLTRWTVKALKVLMKDSGFDIVKVYESPVSFGLYGLILKAFGKKSAGINSAASTAAAPPMADKTKKFFEFAVGVKQLLLTPILSAIGLKGDRVLLVARKR